MANLDEIKKWVEEDTQPKKQSFLRNKYATPVIRAEHKPGPKIPTTEDVQNTLDAMAIGSSPIPVFGDVVGLGADLYRYATDKESRNALNYLFTGAGLLPLVPSGAGLIKRVKPSSNIEKFVQDLEVAGFNRDDIWKKTYDEFGYGVFRGKDKKLRMEIPDTGAQLKIPELNKNIGFSATNATKLEDILMHPKLFEMIPELKSDSVYTSIKLHPLSKRTGYLASKEEINVVAPSKEEATSGFFHELNHLLQAQGNLPRGSSPQQVSSAMQSGDVGPKANELVQKALKGAIRLSEADVAKGLKPEISDEYWYNLTAHTLYRNLLGEVESRAVQRRLTRLPEELKKIPFYKDYDVGEDFIIENLWE